MLCQLSVYNMYGWVSVGIVQIEVWKYKSWLELCKGKANMLGFAFYFLLKYHKKDFLTFMFDLS